MYVCLVVRLLTSPELLSGFSRAAQRECDAGALGVSGGPAAGRVLACVGRLGVRRRAMGDLLLRQNTLRCEFVCL
jgi:hypothetical protein